MNIAFDIDGVLTKLLEFELKYGRNFFNREPNNLKGLAISELFDCSKIHEMLFWIKYFSKYAIKEPAIKDAAETIEKLKCEGDHIYIITARYLAYRKDIIGKIMRLIVEKWLYENKIKYDKIIYCKDSKKEAIIKNGISIIIDDDVHNIKQLSKIIDVICMNNSYNDFIIGDNIHHANDYNEIYEKIKKIKKSN